MQIEKIRVWSPMRPDGGRSNPYTLQNLKEPRQYGQAVRGKIYLICVIELPDNLVQSLYYDKASYTHSSSRRAWALQSHDIIRS